MRIARVGCRHSEDAALRPCGAGRNVVDLAWLSRGLLRRHQQCRGDQRTGADGCHGCDGLRLGDRRFPFTRRSRDDEVAVHICRDRVNGPGERGIGLRGQPDDDSVVACAPRRPKHAFGDR